MNIFYFYDKDEADSFKKSAQAQPDKMLVKMPLETAQMLCTALRELDGDDYADAARTAAMDLQHKMKKLL